MHQECEERVRELKVTVIYIRACMLPMPSPNTIAMIATKPVAWLIPSIAVEGKRVMFQMMIGL